MIQDEGCKKEYKNGKDISNRVYTGACNNKIYSRNIYIYIKREKDNKKCKIIILLMGPD